MANKTLIKILIVEDEALIARDIRQKLIDLGHDVVGIADTGEEAIIMAKETKPHIILMDIVLKGKLTGIETARIIKDKQKISIIYLTAYDSPSVMEQANDTNPEGYLLKPFDDSKLQNVVLQLQIEKAFDG